MDLALCRQWAQDLSRTKERQPLARELEIQARLLRFATALPGGTRHRSAGAAVLTKPWTRKAEQMAGYLARNYRDSPSVQGVARQVGLHLNYAMALFRKTFRCTLNEYLNHYRMAQSQRLLATTDTKGMEPNRRGDVESLRSRIPSSKRCLRPLRQSADAQAPAGRAR